MSVAPEQIAPGVYRIRDTCNVYLIEAVGSEPRTAIAIDFGSGLVLEAAELLGIERITDVLMTHHHRDQGQGLPLAVAAGIAIHVPPVEVDLFRDVEEMWLGRQLSNDYNLRQDRFSLLSSVAVDSVVPEYRTADFGGVAIRTIPTPGHTVGSVSFLLDRDEHTLAFSGDLIFAPGKVWSLAATQWSYSHHEGPAMTVMSCYLLEAENPTLLLPSHGEPMSEPAAALGELAAAMQDYVNSRRVENWDLRDRLEYPWVALTDHLLLNRSSLSCSYALISETGEALFIDYGFDMTTGLPLTSERSARRPWLASIPALKAQFGVTGVTAAVVTHYHDDHVGGLPLLRDVEGTQLWIASTIDPVLSNPLLYDLPCQWYDPIVADRVLPTGVPIPWNEYEITVHEQPGHTLFAVAYEVVVDGVRVMFTGDQQEGLGIPGERREFLNYQYRNRFRLGDYAASAELYRRVGPGLLVSGHWEPRWVEEGYIDYLAEEGAAVDELHERLLPLDELAMGADGVIARIVPYRARLDAGSMFDFVIEVRNPLGAAVDIEIALAGSAEWVLPGGSTGARLEAAEIVEIPFRLQAPGAPARRTRIAADITIDGIRFGQHAEAIIDVVE
jgi:glyoxylase-like metal-dependent hydrolase (beta-lactamase superfamily II)